MNVQILPHQRVLTLEALLAVLSALPPKSKVVFTNGCFDLLHPGHVDLLSRAREMGDVLVVGLNRDASVRRLKGPHRPVVPFEQRAYVLAGLRSVDYVVGFDEDTPLNCIKTLKPAVLIKGGDWPVDKIVGRDTVEALGGLVLSLPLLPGFSSTAIIESIRGM